MKTDWLQPFPFFLSFFFFSELTTAKEDHVSRAVTEIFIIFQRFLFTSVKRQSSVNAIKRCKRLWKRDTTFWARLTLSRHSRRNPFIPVTSVRLSVFILQNAGIWNKKKRGVEKLLVSVFHTVVAAYHVATTINNAIPIVYLARKDR